MTVEEFDRIAPCPDCGEVFDGASGRCWPCTERRHERRLLEFGAPQDDSGPFQVVDLGALLATPPGPTPWRVHGFVADATLTVLAAESGAGKSMLAQALCAGVEHGATVAGLRCKRGHALYVDAEMGRDLFARRTWAMTGGEVPPYGYVDGLGADISDANAVARLGAVITRSGAQFVVLDSLKALTPSRDENSNTEMGPVVVALRSLTRSTGAAIVLIHHKGKSAESSFRGATVIRDQCDALFSLQCVGVDRTRKLSVESGGKMRYAEEPEPVFMRVDMAVGGIAEAEKPDDDGINRAPVTHAIRERIMELMPETAEPMTGAAIAKALGRRKDDATTSRTLRGLEADGLISRTADGWVVNMTTADGNMTTGVVLSSAPLGVDNVTTPRADRTRGDV